jgi:hypothetical protein
MLLKILFNFLFFLFFANILLSQTVGTILNSQNSWQGYTLLNPLADTNTYLIDNCGQIINQWKSDYFPGANAVLNENGDLIRSGNLGNQFIQGAGGGGIIERFDWDGNLLWHYQLSDSVNLLHHDFDIMPNGNILAVVWEKKDSNSCIQAGKNPALLVQGSVWVDNIIEIEPYGIDSGTIVWKWSAFDHLVQDFDNSKANFGDVSNSPRKLDFNSGPNKSDWMHVNAIDYNHLKDIIVFSVPEMNEILIIDHSTSTVEAAGSTGGNFGFGGGFLYRWGNPLVYGQGSVLDAKLGYQHNVHWIDSGLQDAGKLMIFNNRLNNGTDDYSSVFIINPDTNSSGDFELIAGKFGPVNEEWNYDLPVSLASSILSGAQRLANGNTLVLSGRKGVFLEIDSQENLVWQYKLPIANTGILSQGSTSPSQFLFNPKRYSSDFPGFTGKNLTPGIKIELNPLNDCQIFMNDLSVQNPVLPELAIFPNPGREFISIESSLPISAISITDISGQTLYSFYPNGLQKIALNDIQLTPGVYIFSIEIEGEYYNRKFVRN